MLKNKRCMCLSAFGVPKIDEQALRHRRIAMAAYTNHNVYYLPAPTGPRRRAPAAHRVPAGPHRRAARGRQLRPAPCHVPVVSSRDAEATPTPEGVTPRVVGVPFPPHFPTAPPSATQAQAEAQWNRRLAGDHPPFVLLSSLMLLASVFQWFALIFFNLSCICI